MSTMKRLRTNGENTFIEVQDDINRGHKIALKDIGQDQDIIKYGYPIGCSTKAISRGQWVHIHNMKSNLSDHEDYTYI